LNNENSRTIAENILRLDAIDSPNTRLQGHK
jgi:hypothetical protein